MSVSDYMLGWLGYHLEQAGAGGSAWRSRAAASLGGLVAAFVAPCASRVRSVSGEGFLEGPKGSIRLGQHWLTTAERLEANSRSGKQLS